VSRQVTVRPVGVATAAVAATARWASGEAGLQSCTLLHDVAPQRVLCTSGSAPIGVAPRDLCIAGRWQDHVLFQLLHEPGMR
jgi:ribosomal-protein-alanine N-acetyltransferase